jgi:AhpC/TSA family
MSLTDQLEIRRAVARKHIPPEKLAVMDRCTGDLAQSGIIASCLGEGDTAPDFTLTNTQGRPVSIKELLKKGPVVLAFYRGGW